MNQIEFIDKYKISDIPPSDPSCALIYAKALAESIGEFVHSAFYAAAEVNANVKSGKTVLLSADYTSLFFRMLFTSVFGRVYLKIDISENNDGIIIDVTADEPLPLSSRELNMLIKTARNAGMTVKNIDGKITLALEFSNSEEYSVYAGDFFSGRRVMHAALCKIFFGQT